MSQAGGRDKERGASSRAWPWAWAVTVALSLAAFCAWLYRMPPDYVCTWGVNAGAAAQFAAAFHLPVRPVDASTFRLGFSLTLGVAWLAYLGLVATGLAGATLPRRHVWALAVAMLTALAVFAPPAMSSDIYAYVGYARLQVVHQLNPYEATQTALLRLGDPTGPFLRWPISSPYGPLWTLTSIAVVLALPKAALLAPLVALKMIGAASVLAMAAGGRRLAQTLSPGRADAVFVAIAFNPIFLVEGVVNGHNDVVMMAFVLWAFVALADGAFLRAFLLVGLAAALKFFPLILAPWFLWFALRQTPPGRRLGVTVAAVFASVSPLVVGFAPFWRGLATLDGLRMRSAYGARMAGEGGHGLLAFAGVYLLLSFWVLRGGLRQIAYAWILGSFFVMILTSGIVFPWYIVWPWAVALVLARGRSLITPALLYGVGLALVIQYVL
jgi:hypothetical protein